MNLLTLFSGLLLTLFGLLLIGAQVNKHQIRPGSVAAWIFRAGALMLLITLLLPGSDPQITQVVRIFGVTMIAASVIIVNHEWAQAGDRNLGGYQFKPTPNVLIFFFTTLFANVLVLLGLARQTAWVNLAVLILLGWMVIFSARLLVSRERLRAGFRIEYSLSAQILGCGALLLMVGTWLAR